MAEQTTVAETDARAATCEACHGSSLHRETARSAFWHGDRLVVVEDIPAIVCSDCREQFFDDATVMLIDRLRGEGFPRERASSEIRADVFKLTAGLSTEGKDSKG